MKAFSKLSVAFLFCSISSSAAIAGQISKYEQKRRCAQMKEVESILAYHSNIVKSFETNGARHSFEKMCSLNISKVNGVNKAVDILASGSIGSNWKGAKMKALSALRKHKASGTFYYDVGICSQSSIRSKMQKDESAAKHALPFVRQALEICK